VTNVIPLVLSARHSTAKEMVVRFAQKKDIDTIICGSRGHGAVKRFFLGSFSNYLVNCAPCNVLITHAPTKQEPSTSTPVEGESVTTANTAPETGTATSSTTSSTPATKPFTLPGTDLTRADVQDRARGMMETGVETAAAACEAAQSAAGEVIPST
jgi:predicted Fe-Mo cluster-binding NifX family protein